MKDDADVTLVRRCRNGDRGAFEQLVVRYQRPIFNAALRLLRDREEARDVAQTTFLKAFTHLADYDPSFKFYSWMYRIAINESLHVLDKLKPFEDLTDHEVVDHAPGPEARAEGEQTTRTIEEALMHIKPELRTVIVLRHFLHLSYEDMGDVLELPEKIVKSRLYMARQLLRDHLRVREVI